MDTGLELTFAIQLIGTVAPFPLHRTRAVHGERFSTLCELKKIRTDGRPLRMLAMEFGLDSSKGGYGREKSGFERYQKGYTDIECWCMLHEHRGMALSFCDLPCCSSSLLTRGKKTAEMKLGRDKDSDAGVHSATRRGFLSRVQALDNGRLRALHRARQGVQP